MASGALTSGHLTSLLGRLGAEFDAAMQRRAAELPPTPGFESQNQGDPGDENTTTTAAPPQTELARSQDYDCEIDISRNQADKKFQVLFRSVISEDAMKQVPEYQRRNLVQTINGDRPLSEKMRAVADLFQAFERRAEQRQAEFERQRALAEVQQAHRDRAARMPQNPYLNQAAQDPQDGGWYSWESYSRRWVPCPAPAQPQPQMVVMVSPLAQPVAKPAEKKAPEPSDPTRVERQLDL